MLAHTSPIAHGTFIVGCCAALAAYGVAWVRTPSAQTPTRSPARLWSWAGGLVALAVSTAPTAETWAAASFTGHMVQHLLMIVVAAPLLVLARPVSTVSSTWPWPRSVHHRAASSWWRRTGPWLAPALFLATLYVTHLTDLYDAALGNQFLHDVEHLAYVGTACALWSVATSRGRASAPRRVGAVFAVIGGSALLWVVVLSATTPLVPTYARDLGVEGAIDDQRGAASLMWVGGMAITLPLLVVSVWRWAAAEERIAERVESVRGSHAGTASEPDRADRGAGPV